MVRMAPLNMKESNYEPGFKLMARSPSDYVLRQRHATARVEDGTWIYDEELRSFISGPFLSHVIATRELVRLREELMVMPDIPGVVEDQLAVEGLISPSISEILQAAMDNPLRPSGPRLSVADRETLRHAMPGGEHLEFVGADFGNIERRILAHMQVEEDTAGVEIRFGTDYGLEEGDRVEVSGNMFTVTGRTVTGREGSNVRLRQEKIKPPAWSIKGATSNDGKPGRWFVLRAGQKFAGPFPSRDIATAAKEYLSNIMDNPHMVALTNKRAMCVDNDEDKNLKSRICDLENTLAKVMDVVQSRGQITGGNKQKRMRVSFKLDHLEEVRRILKGKKTDEVHKEAGRDSSGGHADRRRRDVRVFDADRSASS